MISRSVIFIELEAITHSLQVYNFDVLFYFYAAVEMRDNPQWCNLPIAVGGNGPRGVCAAMPSTLP